MASQVFPMQGNPRQIFVPYNGKIADITHADTNKHTLDLATALSETRKIIALVLTGYRVTGTGYMCVYPNEGVLAQETYYGTHCAFTIIANGSQRVQYALSVAGEDFDMRCFGYVVEA